MMYLYLFDVEKGDRIERFMTEDPVQAMSNIIDNIIDMINSPEPHINPGLIIRVEQMEVQKYPKQEAKEDSPKTKKRA
jgi:hypothetical protein